MQNGKTAALHQQQDTTQTIRYSVCHERQATVLSVRLTEYRHRAKYDETQPHNTCSHRGERRFVLFGSGSKPVYSGILAILELLGANWGNVLFYCLETCPKTDKKIARVPATIARASSHSRYYDANVTNTAAPPQRHHKY